MTVKPNPKESGDKDHITDSNKKVESGESPNIMPPKNEYTAQITSLSGVEEKLREILEFNDAWTEEIQDIQVKKLLELFSESTRQAVAEERERVIEQIKNWAIETGKFDTAIQRDVVKYHELRNLLTSLSVQDTGEEDKYTETKDPEEVKRWFETHDPFNGKPIRRRDK